MGDFLDLILGDYLILLNCHPDCGQAVHSQVARPAASIGGDEAARGERRPLQSAREGDRGLDGVGDGREFRGGPAAIRFRFERRPVSWRDGGPGLELRA